MPTPAEIVTALCKGCSITGDVLLVQGNSRGRFMQVPPGWFQRDASGQPDENRFLVCSRSCLLRVLDREAVTIARMGE